MKRGKKSIIERVGGELNTPNEIIAQFEGLRAYPNPIHYRNIENGEEYFHIEGGFAWPGKQPGFAVIVGALKTDDWRLSFKVLAEIEEQDHADLLWRCAELRGKFGFWNANTLQTWICDCNKFYPFITECNMQLIERDGDGQGFYHTEPAGFEKANRFELYLNRIKQMMKPGDSGEKMLRLGGNPKLRNHLANLPPDAAFSLTEEACPAAAALGYVVHTLYTYEHLWKKPVKAEASRTRLKSMDDLERGELRGQRSEMNWRNQWGGRHGYGGD